MDGEFFVKNWHVFSFLGWKEFCLTFSSLLPKANLPCNNPNFFQITVFLKFLFEFQALLPSHMQSIKTDETLFYPSSYLQQCWKELKLPLYAFEKIIRIFLPWEIAPSNGISHRLIPWTFARQSNPYMSEFDFP